MHELAKIYVVEVDSLQWSRTGKGQLLEYALSPVKKDDSFYIALRSFEEAKRGRQPQHLTARSLAGKKVRITMEVFDEVPD